MARFRIRAPATLLVVVLLATLAGGCGSSSGTDDGTGCEHWCGNGSATVTLRGVTTEITGGGCYDFGAEGVDARFGDWQDDTSLTPYLTVTAYRAGGPTPPPEVTPAIPPLVPTPTGHPTPKVMGAIPGVPFILGEDAVVTLSASGRGTFSGVDVNEGFAVTGTFNCG
jgi:hypothetical protein